MTSLSASLSHFKGPTGFVNAEKPEKWPYGIREHLVLGGMAWWLVPITEFL